MALKKISFLYIVMAGLLWGTSVIFVRFLEPYNLTSLQMTAVRGVVSLVVLAVFLIFCNKKLFKFEPKNLIYAFGAGFSMYLTATCYYISMRASSAPIAVVLMYTAPIYIIIFSVVFLAEKLNKLKLTSIILMLVGCALVSGIIGGLKFSFWGIVSGLVSGIAYGGYNIFTKIEMRKGVNPLSATFYCYIFMAFFGLITSSPLNIITVSAENPTLLIPMLLVFGLLTSVVPYFLYTLGLKHLPAGTASTLGIIEPLATTIYSIAFFNEKLSIPATIGIILILSATVILGKADK